MPKKADNIEVLHRTRQVMEWLLDGYLTNDIVKSCTAKWNIDERMAYKYIKKAFGEFKSIQKGEIKERLAFHLSARLKLYSGLEEKKRPAGAGTALEILKDIAKLEGLYTDKLDLTSKGKEIKTQETVITATLNLT